MTKIHDLVIYGRLPKKSRKKDPVRAALRTARVGVRHLSYHDTMLIGHISFNTRRRDDIEKTIYEIPGVTHVGIAQGDECHECKH